MDIYKVYICSKASDIDKRNYYYQYIISYYGYSDNNTYVYCQNNRSDVHYTEDFLNFAIKKMKYLCQIHEKIAFYFYSSELAYLIINKEPQFKKYIPCLNSYHLIQQLDDKIISRTWLKEFLDIVPFQLLPFTKCLEKIRTADYKSKASVIQYPISCGGEGTYILKHGINDKINEYSQFFSKNTLFLLSPYYEDSISGTCHFIVYEESVLVFPVGICKSILSDTVCQRPIYQGTDYSCSKIFSDTLKDKICKSIKNLGYQLSLIGYRGICGVDFLIRNKNIYIIEINPRYLGSSYLIDMALLDNSLPPLAFFNENAFTQSSLEEKYEYKIDSLNIPYEGYSFSYNEYFGQNSFDTLLKGIPYNWKIFWDGLDKNIPLNHYEKDTYLFRAAEKKDNG